VKAGGVTDDGEGVALHIQHHRAELAEVGKQVLDGLYAVGGEGWVGDGRLGGCCRADAKEAFHLGAREAPLLPNLDALEASILQHAVDRDAVNLEKILNLAGGE